MSRPPFAPARAVIAVVALIAVSCVSCATYPEELEPDLTLVSMSIADVQMFETTARFVVRVTNPSDEPLALSGGALKFELDGRRVGKGLMNQQLTVPPLATETVEVEVYMSNLAIFQKIIELRQATQFDYGLRGVLYVQDGERRRRARVQQIGSFDFTPEAPTDAGGG